MKSVHAFRKCIQLTLIPRNHIQSIQKGHLSNAVIMEKTNNNLGNETHRVITRSYSKKLHERKEDVKPKSGTPLIIGHDKGDKEFYIKMNTGAFNFNLSVEQLILGYGLNCIQSDCKTKYCCLIAELYSCFWLYFVLIYAPCFITVV